MSRGETDEKNRIAIEGSKLVEEALKSNLSVEELYLAQSTSSEPGVRVLLRKAGRLGSQVFWVSDEVFQSVADTETSQGIVALAQLRRSRLDDALKPSSLVVVAHQLQDPGNLGTLIRSGEAFGAAALLVTRNTVNPLNQKTIRASAGSIFRIPVVSALQASHLIEELRRRAFKLIASAADADIDFYRADFRGSVALFVGNEARGLEKEVLSKMDLSVKISMVPAVESLNAAVASSIILCEAAAQRRRV